MSGAALTVVLPWALLVRDNAKYGLMHGRLKLTVAYRDHKSAAALLARQQVRPSQRLDGRVQLVATLHEPNRARTRDVSNYAKFLCDVLTGVAYDDDGQIDDARYIRGPIDADEPRVIVVLSTLER